MRCGSRERSADDSDEGTAATRGHRARTALGKRLGPDALGVPRLEEGVDITQAGRCQLWGRVDQQGKLPLAVAGGVVGRHRFSTAGSKVHQRHGKHAAAAGIRLRPKTVVAETQVEVFTGQIAGQRRSNIRRARWLRQILG